VQLFCFVAHRCRERYLAGGYDAEHAAHVAAAGFEFPALRFSQ
jgi:hypothetical protein